MRKHCKDNATNVGSSGPHLHRSNIADEFPQSSGISCRSWYCISMAALILCGVSVVSFVRSKAWALNPESRSPEGNYKETQPFLASRVSWEGELPIFCKQIMDNPVPQTKNCMQHPDDLSCPRDNDSVTFSQHQQDYYLYTRHFRHLKRSGFYLDIGANDPMQISNTFFMDRCLFWHGICVESNPNYLEPLYRFRSCHLAPTCVSSHDGHVVTFSIFGVRSGIVDKNYKHQWWLSRVDKQSIIQRCTSMALLLQRSNVSVIDFMSLDVEGHELDVLRGFDWDQVTIKVAAIETSSLTLIPITKFLKGKGYERHIPDMSGEQFSEGLLVNDAIFLHKDVIFGSPV